jgi:subtilisin family serine protease
MDHEDLAANTVPGWSVITASPITASAGIDHSTAGAGLAAAAIHNHLGVTGAANCTLLPIDIVGFIDEMYSSIVWAADHDVRVVNLSWSGGDSAVIEEAARYLETKSSGVVIMSGVNGTGFLDYTNQPHIHCISMTDAADNLRSRFGNHIDFAAPGSAVWTTVAGSRYATASGTSFSAPLTGGVVAALLSINPSLTATQVIELLRTTADDLGAPGWDPYFGWGRIHFGRAAAAAQASLPRITSVQFEGATVSVSLALHPGAAYRLWRTPGLDPPRWEALAATAVTNAGTLVLTDPAPTNATAFYRVSTEPTAPQGN